LDALRYTEHADGTLTYEQTIYPNEQDAVEAARRAFDDLDASLPAGVKTQSRGDRLLG
jgi:hypothetical protein